MASSKLEKTDPEMVTKIHGKKKFQQKKPHLATKVRKATVTSHDSETSEENMDAVVTKKTSKGDNITMHEEEQSSMKVDTALQRGHKDPDDLKCTLFLR